METKVTLPNYTERKKAAAIEPANFYIFESPGFRPYGDIANYKDDIISHIVENELTNEIFSSHSEKELTEYVKRNYKLESYYIDFIDFESECIFNDLKHSQLNNEMYVICGTLGTWRGPRSVERLEPENLYNAVMLCLKNCDDYSIYCDNGEIHIKAAHHDGTNEFYIKMLSQKGIENLANYNAGGWWDFFDTSDPANFEKITQDYL